MKPAVPAIKGERVLLRLVDEEDLDLTLHWRNQEHIRKWFVHSDVIALDQHRNWYGKYLLRDNDLVFIIEELSPTSRRIGQVSLYNIDLHDRSAEFGRLMIGDPEASGKGFAKEATRILVEYGLTELELQRIYLEVFQNNVVAINIYKSCGFKEVGHKDDLIQMSVER